MQLTILISTGMERISRCVCTIREKGEDPHPDSSTNPWVFWREEEHVG